MPTFSIVIPTRNRPNLLATAVQSILSNTYASFEIIVADNSDPGLRMKDNPDYVQQEHSDYTSRVRILDPLPYRLSMWDNYRRGAAAATGKYVIMMNDKCIMSPWALDLLVHAFNRAAGVGATVVTWPVPFKYSFSPRRKPGEGSRMYTDDEVIDIINRWDYTNPYEWDVYPHGCNCAYERFDGHERMYEARNPDYHQGDWLLFAKDSKVWHTQDDIMFIPRGIPVRYSVGAAYNNNAPTFALMEYKADCVTLDKPVTNDYSFDNVIEDLGIHPNPAKEHYYKAGVYRAAVDRALSGGGWMNHRALALLEFSPRAAWITGRRLVRDFIRRFTV